jgi:methanogenic corrinoid protein MtbC1
VGQSIALDARALRWPLHACAFVDSPDDEYAALLPFITEGLAAGEKALHLIAASSQAEHFRRLAEAGLDVAACRVSGQLDVRTWEETYQRAGAFDRDAMLAFLVEQVRTAKAAGFPCTRLIGSAGWSGEVPIPLDALVDYESRVNRVLTPHNPALCVYSRGLLDDALAAEVLRAHPFAMVNGVIRANPAFRPAVVSLCERRDRDPVTDPLRERYLAALLRGDRREALDVVVEEGLANDVTVPNLYCKVIQPTLYEIGRLWEEGHLSVTREHLATTISRLALEQLSGLLASQQDNGKVALVACVQGEHHDLGAQMTADLFEMAGFRVRFLGANVPTASLLSAIRDDCPDVLALSVTMSANVAALRDVVGGLREAVGSRVVVAVGGQALAAAAVTPRDLGLDVLRGSASEAIAATCRRLGVRYRHE